MESLILLITSEYTLIIAVGTLVALFMIVIGIRRLAHPKIAIILNKKSQKAKVAQSVLATLHSIQSLNSKLAKELELLGLFNLLTISAALEETKGIPELINTLDILEDDALANNLIFYLNGQVNMLNELAAIEDTGYKLQKDYQQKILYYNREFAAIKTMEQDEELIHNYKADINKELTNFRELVYAEAQHLKTKRQEFKTELSYSNDILNNLLIHMRVYKHKMVDSKKFYFKYMSVA